MYMPSVSGVAAPFAGKLHVEGIQTVVPTKPTDPRKSSTIHVPQHLTSTTLLQRRFHVLLCYHKAYDDDSGWLLAGQIKESLGRALQEEPLIAGRMRRREEDLQIVSNDSGVRLVEAKAEMKLDDFVDKRLAAAELVCWEDVVETNPNFNPLFYVQVTNFSCEGYSIGISCSLLLIDPFVLTTFLKNWSNIHKNIVSNHNAPKIPAFYLPHHGKSYPAQLMGTNTFNNAAETVIFKIPTNILNSDNNIHKNLAARCINEAEREIGRNIAPNLSLFLKVPHEDAKVEICSREGLLESLSSDQGGDDFNGLSSCVRTWDELELKHLCFNEGKKPIYVSCWINSLVDEGSVMIVPVDADNSGFQIVVTFT
ncbi:hypothetical protein ACS0TY_030409 [Phlomoides rotata]